ncbi:MAG: HDOD domain-containing protein [Thermoguttaceae bacterium]|nr:HDOD domain-containing protein [Thermoguttaceae bacterium]MDW8037881.1 HDOD domain-containing protein [Thermoguttaceae bacterium]
MAQGVERVELSPVESHPALARLAARIGEISSLPEVVYRILSLVDDPNTGAEELSAAVRSDPALAMRVMRTVNSPYYGLEEKVSDLQQAIAILGFREIRNLAITSHVATLFRTSEGYKYYSRRGLWQHLVATGIIARMVAHTSGGVPPHEAYLAGLLHDLGWILLDQYAHASFCQLIDALRPDLSPCQVEMELLGFTHAQLGQTVARQWNLPEHLAAAIGFHHQPQLSPGPYRLLVGAVAVGNFLCHRQDVTSLGVVNVTVPPPEIFAQLNLGREELNQIVAQLPKALRSADMMAFLHVR